MRSSIITATLLVVSNIVTATELVDRPESGARVTSCDTSGRDPAGPGSRALSGSRPRIYLHIGEPKTGTSFLQRSLWSNRARLAAHGVLLPGYSHRDHNRASRDLREALREDSDPTDPWTGDWDVLIGQALSAPGAAVISDEILSACNPPQADRAVRSLLSADVHVILTVRDFASVLPAEWQERIKCRDTVGWPDWLESVVATTPAADRRAQSWFWAVHDTLAILDMWSQHIPPDHVHVITVPSRGGTEQLWRRFASVLGVDPSRFDLTETRANPSLGPAEAEFLRQVNQALPADVPDWFYTRDIKRILALDLLRSRPRQAALTLPPGRAGWAQEQSEILIAGLRDAKYHIVGDVGELVPQPASGSYAAPADQPAEQLLDAAVHATAALLQHMYLEKSGATGRPPVGGLPAAAPRPGGRLGVLRLGTLRQLVSRWEWTLLNGPTAKRILRSASHRAAVRRLRILIWRMLLHPARSRG